MCGKDKKLPDLIGLIKFACDEPLFPVITSTADYGDGAEEAEGYCKGLYTVEDVEL